MWFSLPLLAAAVAYSMFWLPQIVRSALRGRTAALTTEYLVGTTICRLLFAFCLCPGMIVFAWADLNQLDYLGYSENILEITPRREFHFVAGPPGLRLTIPLYRSLDLDLWRMDCFPGLRYPATGSLRTYILLTRSSKSPTHSSSLVRHVLTIDLQFAVVKTYDYHPPMRLPDPESPDRSLGDCAICMDAILVDPPAREKGTSTSKDAAWAGAVEGHSDGILNVVHRNVVGAANMRKSYSLAPCHHLFVSFGCRLLIGKFITLTCPFFCVLAYFLSRNGTFVRPIRLPAS